MFIPAVGGLQKLGLAPSRVTQACKKEVNSDLNDTGKCPQTWVDLLLLSVVTDPHF